MWARLFPWLLLAALGLLLFWPLLLHPTQTLYSDYSDNLMFHLPAKYFLVAEWQRGELPLWCPYHFAGAPFIHDIQVAAFYPLTWPLFLVPVDYQGAGMSWLLVVHVVAAGWCMYAYARHQALGPPAAVVAATGYMFAGKWVLHLLTAGHYNMLPLAWLPLAVLLLEQAVARRCFLRATWAGAAYALIVLAAYPYMTFYAGLFLALWTLLPALEGTRTRQERLKGVGRWLAVGAWAAVVAVALSAVQMIPALEAARSASRAEGAQTKDGRFGGFKTLMGAVGPCPVSSVTVQDIPRPNVLWEDRGGFGLFWLAAAAWALVVGDRRRRVQAAVCLLLLGYAFGGSILFENLPGFRLFRFPSRSLMVASLPVALLAGASTQALLDAVKGPRPLGFQLRRCRRILLGALVLLGGLTGFMALGLRTDPRNPLCVLYWAWVPVGFVATWWLLSGSQGLGRRGGVIAWGAVLLADLAVMALPQVEVRPEAEVLAAPKSVRALHTLPPGRVLDRDIAPESPDAALGGGAFLALTERVEALRGFNPVDVRRVREYYQFIAGRDDPLVALKNDFTFPVLGNFPIRHRHLLDLINVRYLLRPAGPHNEGPDWDLKVEDPSAVAFNGLTEGMRPLPPYALYENRQAFPRAFVVPRALRLPERRDVLPALAEADFRKVVFLEGAEPLPAGEGAFRPATVKEYTPNRVTIRVDDGPAGVLVLTDVWFPGWKAAVDGQPVPVTRANFLFRAVPVAAGPHEVDFVFEPDSYRLGRWVTGGMLGLVVLVSLLATLRKSV